MMRLVTSDSRRFPLKEGHRVCVVGGFNDSFVEERRSVQCYYDAMSSKIDGCIGAGEEPTNARRTVLVKLTKNSRHA